MARCITVVGYGFMVHSMTDQAFQMNRWGRLSNTRVFSPLSLRRILLLAAILCCYMAPHSLHAQFTRDISVYPPVLYSGLNVITITAQHGISRIMRGTSTGWSDLTSDLKTPLYRIVSGPTFSQCARKATFVVFVYTMNHDINLHIRTIDCRRNTEMITLSLENLWRVYREDFGTVTLGSTACRTFQVSASGGDFVIDSVGSPTPDFRIRYTGRRPPLKMAGAGVYNYDVCFTAAKVGRVRMPIYVFLRRRYPAGGHNTFVVADTAYVHVIPLPGARPESPPPTRPPVASGRDDRTLVAQPPAIVIPRQSVPVDTPRVIPQATRTDLRTASLQPVSIERPAIENRGTTEPTVSAEILSDPTAHRVVLMPTARSIDSGTIFISNYELAGWLLGYGVNDRLSLLAGALYIPDGSGDNLIATAGGRYQIYRKGFVQGSLGAQANFSRTELSSIVLLAPYATLSLGDDDRRASLMLGYTWRRHTPADSGIAPFNREAMILGLGGDYRIGQHWKLAAETFLLQEAGYQPLILTLRYFDKRFAIDAGLGMDLGILGGRTEGIRVAPVITGTWVF